MKVGQAVWVDGFDEPLIVSQIHDSGVTVRTMMEEAIEVKESDITEV